MEIINYTPPTSWDDKGMNWDDPDPMNIDYFMALLEAVQERIATFSAWTPTNIPIQRLTKGRPLIVETIISLNNYILSIAQAFSTIEDIKNVYTDTEISSNMAYSSNSAKNAMGEIACRLSSYQPLSSYPSFTSHDIVKWLKEAKIFVSKLKYRSSNSNTFSIGYYRKSYSTSISNFGNREQTRDEVIRLLTNNFNASSWASPTLTNESYAGTYQEGYYNGAFNNYGYGAYTIDAPTIDIYGSYIYSDVYLFAYLQKYQYGITSSPLNNIFNASQVFDVDYLEENKYNLLPVQIVNNKFDFREVMNFLPTIPELSDIPSPAPTGSSSPTAKTGFTHNVSGTRPYYLIGDYSKNFNFK